MSDRSKGQSDGDRAAAEAVEAQQQAAAEAADKREVAKDKAASLKAVPAGAEPATERQSGSRRMLTRDRLIEEADALLGAPHYVVAGALHLADRFEYTLDEAREMVREFLNRPVGQTEEG